MRSTSSKTKCPFLRAFNRLVRMCENKTNSSLNTDKHMIRKVKDMHTLVLIRHGESLWNRENRFTGWTDIDLSEKGIEEARHAGRLLKEQGFEFDVAFTSCLKRAIRTLWIVLEEMDQLWIPVHKDWHLNERHYGVLTGLNKKEIAAKLGEEQVYVWRRSYDIPPDPVDLSDPNDPSNDRRYKHVPRERLPHGECLKDTVDRIVPYWNDTIAPTLREGKNVIVASHGNALRALVKHLANISEKDIVTFTIPTGVPLLFKLDDDLNTISYEFLGDPEHIEAAIQAVHNQGKTEPQK